MKLTIVRSKWLRGKPTNSMLLNCNGDMCCLGFLSIAQGFTEQEIKGVQTPADLIDRGTKSIDDFSEDTKFLVRKSFISDEESEEPITSEYFINSDVCCALMQTNDSPSITDKEREEMLTYYFSDQDIEVEFVD